MVDSHFFNFSTFVSTMEVTGADEGTYSLILRNIFSYMTRVYGIDLYASISSTTSNPTTTTFEVPYSPLYQSGLVVESNGETSEILSVVNNIDLTVSTVTLTTAFTLAPTTVKIYTTKVPFDLQYGVYLHAKYLFESQKKNTYVVDSVTDTAGNKASYKPKPPALVHAIYLEYSPNEVAFI